MTLQTGNEHTLVYLFYLNIFTLNLSVKNLVVRYEYMNIKHRDDGGYVKIFLCVGLISCPEESYRD